MRLKKIRVDPEGTSGSVLDTVALVCGRDNAYASWRDLVEEPQNDTYLQNVVWRKIPGIRGAATPMAPVDTLLWVVRHLPNSRHHETLVAIERHVLAALAPSKRWCIVM